MVFKENNKAIYLQIADKICDDVVTGQLAAGARIPSVREYAASLEVNANTVMRSYEYLERSGVIFNRRGIGFFIAETARDTVLTERRESFLKGEMPYFFHQLMLLAVSPDEVKTMYENYLNEKK
ncbi:MAG: GntR family transcriptional regulator [Duncaniella sp.]|nr:GntR family transcriptional regulator [Bacteroides sp.]MDE5827031.1 GntR family transcriptional regulator [Duncaniella sp.]MDE6430157.1 GntR family transcriptional regulator [Duncaniella sp.]MDE6813288.1 GntR family transcriptional regulator [Duncaniella sp.]